MAHSEYVLTRPDAVDRKTTGRVSDCGAIGSTYCNDCVSEETSAKAVEGNADDHTKFGRPCWRLGIERGGRSEHRGKDGGEMLERHIPEYCEVQTPCKLTAGSNHGTKLVDSSS